MRLMAYSVLKSTKTISHMGAGHQIGLLVRSKSTSATNCALSGKGVRCKRAAKCELKTKLKNQLLGGEAPARLCMSPGIILNLSKGFVA